MILLCNGVYTYSILQEGKDYKKEGDEYENRNRKLFIKKNGQRLPPWRNPDATQIPA
jgi:hypothetical protein